MATKPFLKWAGGKTRVATHILPHLNGKKRLVEPFAGSCAIFLLSDLKNALLCDINPDLIRLYKTIQNHGKPFIRWVQDTYFTDDNNTKDAFLENRRYFNTLINLSENATSKKDWARSGLFLYLNRHAFNGMCRYNKSGGYNVPYGKYKKPYFPEKELYAFYEKTKNVTFKCQSFIDTMQGEINNPVPNTVIYCDPPYVELSKTASFTTYSSEGFSKELQEDLTKLASRCYKKGIKTIVSNHDVPPTQNMYAKGLTFTGESILTKTIASKIETFLVTRSISAKGSTRGKSPELLAIYE